ncbi:hypothetical protein BCV69DRAFT_140871 [Microstroma glucosiphilum]|uniref:Uncharacterized protein n=1 Tax=Pseudomicrostroma glucosiphilum TaxID=1684307 RepID=A0A316UAU6_9BASI|nr:hypothetical protein BCV69DRAFT_140871 [Pseudomicrostroma glucosiphilum]PWN22337.1 hypothetical protein BCV69DRAFT_140871 [Pseudomicrostroma glucosiphilum]
MAGTQAGRRQGGRPTKGNPTSDFSRPSLRQARVGPQIQPWSSRLTLQTGEAGLGRPMRRCDVVAAQCEDGEGEIQFKGLEFHDEAALPRRNSSCGSPMHCQAGKQPGAELHQACYPHLGLWPFWRAPSLPLSCVSVRHLFDSRLVLSSCGSARFFDEPPIASHLGKALVACLPAAPFPHRSRLATHMPAEQGVLMPSQEKEALLRGSPMECDDRALPRVEQAAF